MPVGHLHILFGKMSVPFFCPFFNWVAYPLMLSCMSCLYILDINLLSVIFANIFSHSVGCLFILSMVSFAVQKLLSLIRSHLFIFDFISFALGDRSKNKNIDMIYIKEFCLCFPLGVLWLLVLHLDL